MIITLTEKIELTPEVHAYTFAAQTPIPFKAGQFSLLKKPGAEQKCARAFSFASAPENNVITFLMKHNPEGLVSGYLHTSEIGAELEIGNPAGRFVLDPTDTHRVFVATGTGIAPIVSFAEHTKITGDAIPTDIIFGVRNETQLFWTDKLPSNAIITLSQPSENWTGATGRVTNHLSHFTNTHPDASWYLCGSPDMIKDVRSALLAANVPSSKLHFEVY